MLCKVIVFTSSAGELGRIVKTQVGLLLELELTTQTDIEAHSSHVISFLMY